MHVRLRSTPTCRIFASLPVLTILTRSEFPHARAGDLRAVDGGDEALEPELAVDDLGLARDRRLAVAVERGEERALGAEARDGARRGASSASVSASASISLTCASAFSRPWVSCAAVAFIGASSGARSRAFAAASSSSSSVAVSHTYIPPGPTQKYIYILNL